MKIYTKTGDKGTTALIGGTRLPKSHIRIQAYGTVDELNAYIGMLTDLPVNLERKPQLKEIQDRLFTIGSHLATDAERSKKTLPDLIEEDIRLLETAMDEIESKVAPLRAFILPGGHPSVSFGHIARTVCRRAERTVIELSLQEPVEEIIMQYLNRLSDYLFMVSRIMACELEVQEVIWQPRLHPKK